MIIFGNFFLSLILAFVYVLFFAPKCALWVLIQFEFLGHIKLSTLLVKFSADDIMKHFSYFCQKTGLDISCKLSLIETICMKYQILFSEKKKNKKKKE